MIEIVKYILNDGTCEDGKSLSSVFLPTVCTQDSIRTCVMNILSIYLDPLNIRYKVRAKGKVHPITCNFCPEGEWRYSSTLSLTSALDEVGSQRHSPAVLPQEVNRYPLCRKLGLPLERSEQVPHPPGLNPRTVQPVASRYADYPIPTYL